MHVLYAPPIKRILESSAWNPKTFISANFACGLFGRMEIRLNKVEMGLQGCPSFSAKDDVEINFVLNPT